MEFFDEFDDSVLTGEDLIDALERTENIFTPLKRISSATSYSSHVTPNAIRVQDKRDEPEVPDFSDPLVVAALEGAEEQVLTCDRDTDKIILSRAELDSIKRNAFAAGFKRPRKPQPIFRFLDLPAELRLVFYKHYFEDRNPATRGPHAFALPEKLTNSRHCCNDTWCGTSRPHIATALLQTCQLVYQEARDDYLYKDRTFVATVRRLNERLKSVGPNIRFWQHIQHLDLQITSDLNHGWAFEGINLIEHIVALLQGGKNLRSFKLTYANERPQSIARFENMSIQGSVSITQIFKDWSEEGQKQDTKRRERLEKLLFSMLGCSAHDAPAFDFLSWTTENVIDVLDLQAPKYETHMTISTCHD